MAFHFTLEAVLRLRQSLENRELLRLQSLLTRRAFLLRELEESQQLRLNLQQGTKQAMLQRPTPAVEIHFAMARLHALEWQQQIIHQQLRELEAAIVEQRSRFQQERRKRDMLESLRDAQLRDYQQMQRRREQAQLDELHLLRRKQQLAVSS
jgi:flagellar biosynthesis chaperone FliJ